MVAHVVVGEVIQHSPPHHLTTAVRRKALPWYYCPLLYSVNTALLWELPPLADSMRGTPVVLGTLDSDSTQEGSLLDAIALWSSIFQRRSATA